MTNPYGQEYDGPDPIEVDKTQPPTLTNIAVVAGQVEVLLDLLEKSCVEPRWAAMARTDFQKAFMTLRAGSHAKGRKL